MGADLKVKTCKIKRWRYCDKVGYRGVGGKYLNNPRA